MVLPKKRRKDVFVQEQVPARTRAYVNCAPKSETSWRRHSNHVAPNKNVSKLFTYSASISDPQPVLLAIIARLSYAKPTTVWPDLMKNTCISAPDLTWYTCTCTNVLTRYECCIWPEVIYLYIFNWPTVIHVLVSDSGRKRTGVANARFCTVFACLSTPCIWWGKQHGFNAQHKLR